MLVQPLALKADSVVRSSHRVVRKAFTLMEILVVVAIMVILAGLGTVALMNELEKSREKTAGINAKTIKSAAMSFKTDTGNWPASLNELVPQYLERPETLWTPGAISTSSRLPRMKTIEPSLFGRPTTENPWAMPPGDPRFAFF